MQILENFKVGEFETRPVKSNGLWCCVLIPLLLLLYSSFYDVSRLYTETAYLSVGLLVYSILFIAFISISCLVLKEVNFAGGTAASGFSSVMLYVSMNHGLIISIVLPLLSVFAYNMLLRLALVKCPRTFTIGEAMIVMQGVVLWGMAAVQYLIIAEKRDSETHLINSVVVTGLSTVGLLVTALIYLPEKQRTLDRLGYLLAAAVGFALVLLHLAMGMFCVPQVLRYIFRDQTKMLLIAFWVFLLFTAVMALIVRTNMGTKATSGTRKAFHILASLVFTSGIIVDVQFMRLAAGLGLCVLIFVEALRKSGIDPMSSTLESTFKVYKDEKDCGYFAVTPIYMYLGLACPLVLVPEHSSASLELLSGVLSTGIGDTAASWFGERYGVNKWPDSDRTLEGTAFNIISQVITIYVLQVFEVLDASYAVIRTAVAATVVGIIEARTVQVDNLILPLIMLISYQITAILA